MENKIAHSETPPKYNVRIVEAVLLEVAVDLNPHVVDLNPQYLSARELSLKIIGDPNDNREVETAAQAIQGLKECGLFSIRDDEIVQPTPAALRAFELVLLLH